MGDVMAAFPNDMVGKALAFRVIEGEIVEFDPNQENAEARKRAEKLRRQLEEARPATNLIQ